MRDKLKSETVLKVVMISMIIMYDNNGKFPKLCYPKVKYYH